MKVVNNKTDSKKRKRDESQDAVADSPKRAKVHAQRKFAQGASYNSPSVPLIKDKVRPPASLSNSGLVFSSTRPNTEDFLTFLCFRRTEILPNRLNYFNNAYREQLDPPDNIEEISTSAGCQRNNHFENPPQKTTSRKNEKNETQKKFQTPVQALRRKYQEQRLAKQKSTNVTKLAQKVKGKNMIRTRSSTLQEEKMKPAKEISQLNDGVETLSGLRSGLQRAPPPTSKYLKRSVKLARMKSLRSRVKEKTMGHKMMTKTFGKKSSRYSREIPPKKSMITRNAKLSEILSSKVNAKKIEKLSDFSSDDNEPLLTVKKEKRFLRGRRSANGIREGLRPNSMKTRSQNLNITEPVLNSPLRPTRKTKEAAAIYMEMITKKLVSPEKSGDDDRSSVDSFPELPNARRNEQRESEIKARAMAMRKGYGKGNNSNPRSENKKGSNIFKKKGMKKKNSITSEQTEFIKKNTKDNEQKKVMRQESAKPIAKEQTKKPVKASVAKKQAKEEVLKKFAKSESPKKYLKEEKSKINKEENSGKPNKNQKKKKPKEETSKKLAREDSSKKVNEDSKKYQKNKKEYLSNKNMKEENMKVSDESSKKNSKEDSGKKSLKEEMNKKTTQEVLCEDSPKKPFKEDSSKKKEESGKKSSKEEVNKKVTQEVFGEEPVKKPSKDSAKKNYKEESGKKSREEINKKAVQDAFHDGSSKKPGKLDSSKKKEESGKKSSKEEVNKKVTQEASLEEPSKKPSKEETTRRKNQNDDAPKKVAKDESQKKNLREEAAKKRGAEDAPKKMLEEESHERKVKDPGLDEPSKKIMKGESTMKSAKEDLIKSEEDTTEDEMDIIPASVKKGGHDDVIKKNSKDNVKKTSKEESQKKIGNEDFPNKTFKDESSKKGTKEKKDSKSLNDDESNDVFKIDLKNEKLVETDSDDETLRNISREEKNSDEELEVVKSKQTKDVQNLTEKGQGTKEKRDKSEKEPCKKYDAESTKSKKEKDAKEGTVKNAPHDPQKKVSDSDEERVEKKEKSTENKQDNSQKRGAKNMPKESESDSKNKKSDDTESRSSTRGKKSDESESKSKKDRTGSKRTNLPPRKGSAAGSSAPSGNWFPPPGSASNLVEAPTFYPTEKEFQDPLEFFERIRPAAESFGLCRIVPPSTFKPDCKVSDDMRFTAYNQYVHRMFHRWGPNIKEMMAIKKYLATQSISLKQPPWIGGIEVDLPRLYQSVQNCGGLMKVMEKKKWNQVADMMRIPKAAQDRVTKLDDIYCKYLLPYDTLSQVERQKLFDEVESDWLKRQDSTNDVSDDESEEEFYIDECEECIVKGRNMALNQFYRIARNTMSMWFKTQEPLPSEVENEFWRHVSERNNHVCVHSGSIDSSGWGYGFPVAKNNTFSKHPWNLKVLTNNSGSVLRSLGPVMGVTVPTLHVGMVFTAFCWYRDPHGLPWVEYLHTGAPKIWYGISDDNSSVFKEALTKLLPRYIKNKKIWLPSDTAMVPPALLVDEGVSLCHTIQQPGQFILVFPRAFTSSICTGYLVSESVYFAQPSWLCTAEQVFRDIQDCCEPTMFSLEKLLFSIATDSRSSVEVLKQVLPMVWHIKQNEIDGRKTLMNLGLKLSERLPVRDQGGSKKKKGRWAQDGEGDYECEVCRTNLCVSLVINSQEETVLCLPHAIELLTQKRNQLKYCKLMYSYTQDELCELVEKLEQRIESKSQKKTQSKSSTSSK